MSEKQISIVISAKNLTSAEFANARRELAGLGTSVDGASKQFATMGASFSAAGSKLTSAGQSLSMLAVPIAAIGIGAAKAAIDFESSFAGVRKTVNATEPEFQALAQGFRDLSKEIPINVNELNRLGEAAGALGIPKAEIVDFSRVMALLGVTTNVTSDEAASSIAKIQNVFGAAGKDTENFASTLVALGNEGASTEHEILELANRIASAGNAVGLTQGQVLGFASAIANVGIEAEAGGTAMSKTLIDISQAVSKGGEDLAGFARVAGVSSQAFAAAFKHDAADATRMFIEGLGRIKESGGDLNITLENLGIKEVRHSNLLRSLALSGDNVSKSLALQAKAWSENSALAEEAKKRFETLESQMTLLWNRVKDVGITIGLSMLPAMKAAVGLAGELIPVVEGVAHGFAGLSGAMQLGVIGLGAVVVAAGPAILVLGTVVRSIGAVMQAMVVGQGALFAFGNSVPILTARLWLMDAAGGALALTLSGLAGMVAVAATAWASWQFGKWLGDATGATDLVGRMSAKLGEFIGLLPKGTAEQYNAMRAAQAHASALEQTGAAYQRVAEDASDFVGPLEDTSRRARAAADALALTEKQVKALEKAEQDRLNKLKASSELESKIISENKAFRDEAIKGIETEQKAWRDYYNWIGERRMENEAAEMDWRKKAANPDWLTKMFVPLKSAVKEVHSALQLTFEGIGESFQNIGNTILQAVQGGGSVIKSIGSSLGMGIGKDLSENLSGFLTRNLGKTLGDAVGTVLPGVGALIGPLMGKIAGLFTDKNAEEVRKYNGEIAKVHDSLLQQYGDMEHLEAAANRVGLSFKENWGHQGKDGLEATNRLMEQLEQRTKAVAAANDRVLGGTAAVIAGMTKPWTDLGDRMKKALEDFDKADKALSEGLQSGKGSIDELTSAWNEANDAQAEVWRAIEAAAPGAKQELADLGVIAVGSFGAALTAGKSYMEALQAAGPQLVQLGDSYKALGLDIDEVGLSHLTLQATVAKTNPELIAAAGGLASSMQGLAQLGRLNSDNFEAMQRTGGAMYARIQGEVAKLGGDSRDALMPMQDFLHQAVIQAELLGFPLDANTQMLIEQSQALGIWQDKGKTAQDLLIEGMQTLVDKVDQLLSNMLGVSNAITGLPARRDVEINITTNERVTRYITEQAGGDEPGYAGGTYAEHGYDFPDFGSGTRVVLHRREAVVPYEDRVPTAQRWLAEAQGSGGAAGATIINNNHYWVLDQNGKRQLSESEFDHIQQRLDAGGLLVPSRNVTGRTR